jgi:uncharacterized protein
MTTTGSTAPSTRVPVLDILRGLAILGTLGTNIWVFSAAGTPLLDSFIQTRVTLQGMFEVFSNGKFLSLLAMLFGVGIAIQYDSARRRGNAWPGRYLWRSTLLFLEGLFHFTLLFEGDILMGYAVAAVIVAVLLNYGERFVRWGMAVAAGLHLLLVSGIVMLVGSGAAAGDAEADIGFDAYATLLLRDNYLAQVAARLENVLVLRAEPILALPYAVLLFLLGVQLYRSGVFVIGTASTPLQRALRNWGLGLGLPLNALALLPAIAPGLLGDSGQVLLFLALRYGCSAILACGYIGLVLWLVRRSADSWLWTQLTAVGRTALSTYVSQSVLLSLIFYGWGLGLGSQLSDWQIGALFVALALAQVWIAGLWMRRLGGGPLELVRKRLEQIGLRPVRSGATNDV